MINTKLNLRYKIGKIINFTFRNKRTLFFVLGSAFLLYLIIVKIIAITKLGYFSDEPDDLALLIGDLSRLKIFFTGTVSADQARLPHLLVAPIVVLFKTNSLIPSRLFFILIHCIYLFVLYKLFRLTLSKVKSIYGILLVASSAYLFSFSIFAMTTSNNLAILFDTLLLYLYLKNYKSKYKMTINQVVIFGLVFGLAIGSRFFGAITLVSIFLFDAYINKRTLFRFSNYKIWALPFEKLNILFTVALVLINISSISLIYKTFVAFGVVLIYIYYFVFIYFKDDKKEVEYSFLEKWIVITHTAFVFALIGSPVHLNFNNIIKIFGWSNTWHKVENYINPSRFDIFTIIGVKMGWLAGIGILIAIGIIIWRRQTKKFLKTYSLIILVVLLQLIAFTIVKYVIVWYPIYIMPFLYLPLIYIFPDSKKQLSKPIGIILFAILMFIPFQEQYRYWRLFPYGHIDGAQYGKQYVGWNKPGTISFEASYKIADYLKENHQNLAPGIIDCRLTKSLKYNLWASERLNLDFQKAGIINYNCLLMSSNEQTPYVITSLYIPENEKFDLRQTYKEEKIFYEAGIPFASFWVHDK